MEKENIEKGKSEGTCTEELNQILADYARSK